MTATNDRGITVRALITGILLAAAIGGGAAYENLMISGSTMNFDYSMGAALFAFSLLVLIVNPALRLARRSWGFSPVELATLYIMAMVACVLPTNGLVGMLIPAISGGIYYASAENKWLETVLPHLQPWLIVGDRPAARGFFEGLSRGERILWEAWLEPLAAWGVLVCGLLGSIVASTIMLRRQWMDNERLLYPLAQVPIALIGGERENGIRPASIVRNPVFWLGAGVPLVLYSMKALHHYHPNFPMGLPTFIHVLFADGAVDIPMGINWAGIGFGFLLTTKLSFSIWFMAALTIIEEVVLMRVGLFSGERLVFNTSPAVYPAYQGTGAMLVFSATALWVARRHIGRFLVQAWRGGGEGEREELLTCRQTVFLLTGSLALVASWLVATGMPAGIAAAFLVLFFLLLLGITRVVVEGGLAVSRIPILPGDFVVAAVGSANMPAASVGALGMTLPWAGEMRTSAMSAMAHGLKLAHGMVAGQRKRLLLGIAAAMAASICCAAVTMFLLGYRHGAVNLSAHWFFGTAAGGRIFNFISYHLAADSAVRWDSLAFVGFGGMVQILLTLAHQRLAWWPIHPLSFPIGAVWCTHQVMASMFVAWVAKTVALHHGGVGLYNRVRPFFLGLILGQYLTGGMWLMVDGITGMQGNYLFFW